MGDRPEPAWFNPAYTELNRLVEAMTNLMYLMQHHADDPTKVQYYVGYGERCLERMRVIVHEQMGRYSPN
jgi:hypothetical protein